MRLWNTALFLIVVAHIPVAGGPPDQIPATPAGRQFSAWLAARDSQDEATIRKFVELNMLPPSTVDQMLANRKQTGGYDVLQVEESSATTIVVLARQRTGGQALVRITLDVAAQEPYRVIGVRVRPVDPLTKPAGASGPQPEPAIPAILSLFETYQVVGMDAAHRMKDVDDFILALIRTPGFADAVNEIVVECGNALHQPILDRYIAGEDVPFQQARQAWRNATGMMCSVSAFYEQLFPLVRRINQRLPPTKRLRVIAADVPIDWNAMKNQADMMPLMQRREEHIVDVMEKEVFAKRRKALMLFGIGHLVHGLEAPAALANFTVPSGVVARYERMHPGVTFVIGTAPGTCGTPGSAEPNTLQAVMEKWPVPSLVRTRGTTLPGRLLVDAYLYLGPRELALAELHPADVFLDAEFMAELQRRAALTGWLDKQRNASFAISWSIDPEKVREESANPFIFCA